ncbi:SoxR reducing system RseC family protein [Rodentibacter caecimuris]|uniref:Transcriptional regulator n=1 Tax=Rodentibacter caecimuris TaxID=1796644 RepID=A0ABX3KYL0_9PAST|nr:hypothetical protein BKG89_05260 [Rodentibacter heylii]
MLKELAEVVSYQSGVATVKCRSQSACGQCMAKNHCGTSALSELNGKTSEHIFILESITPLKVGQIIEIGIEEKSMLFSALLLYIIPLFTLLSTTILTSYWFESELIRTGFIFFSTALSFVVIKIFTKHFSLQKEFHPILLKIVH